MLPILHYKTWNAERSNSNHTKNIHKSCNLLKLYIIVLTKASAMHFLEHSYNINIWLVLNFLTLVFTLILTGIRHVCFFHLDMTCRKTNFMSRIITSIFVDSINIAIDRDNFAIFLIVFSTFHLFKIHSQ